MKRHTSEQRHCSAHGKYRNVRSPRELRRTCLSGPDDIADISLPTVVAAVRLWLMANRANYLALVIMGLGVVLALPLAYFGYEVLAGAAFVGGMLMLWISAAAMVVRCFWSGKRNGSSPLHFRHTAGDAGMPKADSRWQGNSSPPARRTAAAPSRNDRCRCAWRSGTRPGTPTLR